MNGVAPRATLGRSTFFGMSVADPRSRDFGGGSGLIKINSEKRDTVERFGRATRFEKKRIKSDRAPSVGWLCKDTLYPSTGWTRDSLTLRSESGRLPLDCLFWVGSDHSAYVSDGPGEGSFRSRSASLTTLFFRPESSLKPIRFTARGSGTDASVVRGGAIASQRRVRESVLRIPLAISIFLRDAFQHGC